MAAGKGKTVSVDLTNASCSLTAVSSQNEDRTHEKGKGESSKRENESGSNTVTEPEAVGSEGQQGDAEKTCLNSLTQFEPDETPLGNEENSLMSFDTNQLTISRVLTIAEYRRIWYRLLCDKEYRSKVKRKLDVITLLACIGSFTVFSSIVFAAGWIHMWLVLKNK